MTSCTRTNDTALQCEHGCCGDNANQKCCSFELSETIIIVSCVVGALIVFSTVIMLVHCITKKKKDAVRPIRHRRRQPRDREAVRRRRQMTEMPPPPPYTEAPPEYNSWNQTNRATPTFPARSDTEHEHAAPSRSSQTRTTRNPPQPEGRTLSTISNTRVHTQSDIPIIVASRASHVVDTPQFNEHDKNRSVSRHVSSPTEEDYRKMARNRHVASVVTSSQDTNHVTKPKVHRSSEPIITSTRPSNRRVQGYNESDRNSVELPGIVGSLPESPPPSNPTAAVRSAKRRAVLLQLEHRRRTRLDFSSSDEDSFV